MRKRRRKLSVKKIIIFIVIVFIVMLLVFCSIKFLSKGKGVSFMENACGWHGKAPGDADYEIAVKELDAALAELN